MTALCDVCQKRPGKRAVVNAGIETWVCDFCSEGSPWHECPRCSADCDCQVGFDACEHDCMEADFGDRDADE